MCFKIINIRKRIVILQERAKYRKLELAKLGFYNEQIQSDREYNELYKEMDILARELLDLYDNGFLWG